MPLNAFFLSNSTYIDIIPFTMLLFFYVFLPGNIIFLYRKMFRLLDPSGPFISSASSPPFTPPSSPFTIKEDHDKVIVRLYRALHYTLKKQARIERKFDMLLSCLNIDLSYKEEDALELLLLVLKGGE